MRRFLILCALCIVCAASAWAQQAKYVFYFIGDGMGLNQINTTEYYMASAEGKWGYGHLSFADFPYTTYAAIIPPIAGLPTLPPLAPLWLPAIRPTTVCWA